MELKIAPNDVQSMSQDGDSILRSLQNKSMPMIDLLVRESLQNSLDATLFEEENTIVNFSTGNFDSHELSEQFTGITDTLNQKYSDYTSFLSIKDSNTTGLTGDYNSDEQNILDDSNFHKLVFGIGKNQDKAGAGGSWGLGKTSYFRVGIGIVIYYTRVFTSEGYEERLIASLIESPKEQNRLLPESERGIAWWGEYDKDGKKILPLTENKKIADILRIFNIDQYSGTETGTTIVIPYLKQEHLSDNTTTLPWETDYSDSLRMAVKRWYNPRLANHVYFNSIGNSKLLCTVNNEILFLEEPIFKKFQSLYNAALQEYSDEKNIVVKNIFLPRSGMVDKTTKVGTIAFCEVNREEMEMNPPHNRPSPLAYLGLNGDSEQFDSKIVAYSRMPGMVVEYDFNGDWTPTGNIVSEEHILLAFFVPNSFGELYYKYTDLGYINLESYLRATENADHANWIDEDGISIIKRTKGYTSKEIQEYYQILDGDSYSSATSALSRKFGNILMPPRSFGKSSNRSNKSIGGQSNKLPKKRTSNLSIISTKIIDNNLVKVSFSIILKANSISVISLLVLTQEKKMNIETWRKTMEEVVPFPFKIQGKPSFDFEEANVDAVDIESTIDILSNSEYEVQVRSLTSEDIELMGELILDVHSNQYIPTLTISSNINSKEDN